MTLTLSVEGVGRTHVGLVRRRNEDSYHVGHALLAVADGLGGHVAGDVASATVIDAIRPHDNEVERGALSAVLGRAVRDANDALRKRTEAEPALAGMGSTLVAMLCAGPTAVVANVGDSRAYLLRDSRLVRITEDHTFGHLVADAARVPNLPERLSRFLDGRPDGRSPDLTTWNLRLGDRFLLCSDGLSSYVAPQAIFSALKSSKSRDEAADRLISLAIDRGGPDNVTVIVIDVLVEGDQN